MQAPKALEMATRANLSKTLADMIKEGEYVTITDAALPVSLELSIKWVA
jgi:ubiquitin-activating enzyme E1 C